MKLLLALAVAALVLLAACGDDDGPAADIGGVWNGQMESISGLGNPHFGPVCIEIEQDGREITGRVVFQVEGPHPMGGRIANETLSFVWSSGASPTGTPAPISFGSGGTFAGTVAADAMSGTWYSLIGDNGTWSATRGATESCG